MVNAGFDNTKTGNSSSFQWDDIVIDSWVICDRAYNGDVTYQHSIDGNENRHWTAKSQQSTPVRVRH